jgi:hypothetical protein
MEQRNTARISHILHKSVGVPGAALSAAMILFSGAGADKIVIKQKGSAKGFLHHLLIEPAFTSG